MPKYLDETGLTRFYDNIADRPVQTFETVASMQAATWLKSGMTCHTNGFHASGDGGAAYYTVSTSGTSNGMDVLALQGGLFATLVVTEPYVTPEQFGAYGDGTHDDTAAWSKAVSIGCSVKAASKTYLCGQVEVTKNIEIDCNNAVFSCNADTLFYCHGKVTVTISDAPDYAAYQADYAITNSGHTTYTGFARLRGSNNFEPSRNYYMGGFVCTFENGKMTNTYPIPVTDVTIELVEPITASIVNIGDLTHTETITNNTQSIKVLYGMNCYFGNINESNGSSYAVFVLNLCLSCIIDRSRIYHHLASSSNNSYIVSIANSSYCVVSNSTMHNRLWHCISTGDQWLCYNNRIENCVLSSDKVYAFEDHENALGTVIKDTTITGAGVSVCALATIENVTLNAHIAANAQSPVIRLVPCAIRENAEYSIRHVRLMTAQNNTGRGGGVWLAASPQVAGNTYYYKRIDIEDIRPIGAHEISFEFAGLVANSSFVIEKIAIRNSWINVYAALYQQTNVDISKYVLELIDMNTEFRGLLPQVGNAGYVFGTAEISNCRFYKLAGTFTNVRFTKLYTTASITELIVTGQLFGSCLESWASQTVLNNPAELMIDVLRGTDAIKWINLVNSGNGKYYQVMENGVLVTKKVTP